VTSPGYDPETKSFPHFPYKENPTRTLNTTSLKCCLSSTGAINRPEKIHASVWSFKVSSCKRASLKSSRFSKKIRSDMRWEKVKGTSGGGISLLFSKAPKEPISKKQYAYSYLNQTGKWIQPFNLCNFRFKEKDSNLDLDSHLRSLAWRSSTWATRGQVLTVQVQNININRDKVSSPVEWWQCHKPQRLA
jgi:hypothetical protein